MNEITYSIEEALRAQAALRDAAGLDREQFPLTAFIGMISDEIEALRAKGVSDAKIAELVRAHSSIEITSGDIETHYAPPELRASFVSR